MADKKKLTLEELAGKPNHEILALALAGECDGTIAALAMGENDKTAKAELTAAKSAAVRIDVTKPAIEKSGDLRWMAGKKGTAFQLCQALSKAETLVKIMRDALKSADDKTTTATVESRVFGGKTGEKAERTVYRFGKLNVASKPEHVEFVRKFLADFKS